MDNGIRFSKDQLKFLSGIIMRNAPAADPNDDAITYTRQAYRDVSHFLLSLGDPENMKRVTKPGTLSE